jgi:hypothetical protein
MTNMTDEEKQWPKNIYPVKVTLPSGIDRLLIMNDVCSEIALTAVRLHLFEILTDGGYLSGEDAVQEIEHYAFAIATPEENDRLRYHLFKREEVVTCPQ